MKSVCFVCLGNICRSPMAEAVLRDKIKKLNLEVIVDSAGTGDWHIGDPPHEGTQKILNQHQICFEKICARQIKPKDFENFDYLIVMDNKNYEDVCKMGPQEKVKKFMDFLPSHHLCEVPDPYFTGDFDETYALIEAGCDYFIKEYILKD